MVKKKKPTQYGASKLGAYWNINDGTLLPCGITNQGVRLVAWVIDKCHLIGNRKAS